MEYPKTITVTVPNVFGETPVEIVLNSGLTTLVGTNASGKTQTLKQIRNNLRKEFEDAQTYNAVRYLSSNRLANMELFRSNVDGNNYLLSNYSVGSMRDRNKRHQLEVASGDFFIMDDRRDVYIKVAERLSSFFGREFRLEWDAGNLKVYLKKRGGVEYSVAAEASGLINLISILVALYDDAIKVLLIDEPEVSLHPQLQSYLLREIKRTVDRYDKTVILSTHSAEMIELSTADDLCNIVFFRDDRAPLQLHPDDQVLLNQKLQDFILRMGLVYHEGFFAKKVMLVEGASDLLFCRFLCNQLDLNIDAAGTQLIPVDGKGQFPTVVKLFRTIGKDVCVLTDLDTFVDDDTIVNLFTDTDAAHEIAGELGILNLHRNINDCKSRLAQLIRENHDALIHKYEAHPYWIHRKTDEDEEKAERRAVTAQLFTASEEELDTWPAAARWKELKSVLSAQFNLLEKLGCFILHKGAIESYYHIASQNTYDGKPSAAVEEIQGAKEQTVETIRSWYDDIVRAVEFAAVENTIDESEAVRSELASELAPAVLKLESMTGCTPNEAESSIHSAVRRAKNGTKSIFIYNVIIEGERKQIRVELPSAVLDVKGFPLTVNDTDDVLRKIKGEILPE